MLAKTVDFFSFSLSLSFLALMLGCSGGSFEAGVLSADSLNMSAAPDSDIGKVLKLYNPNPLSNGDSVIFSGTCLTGKDITVKGAATAVISATSATGCQAGRWSYASGSFTSDASRSFSFEQIDDSGQKVSVTGTWTRNTAPGAALRQRSQIVSSASFPRLAAITIGNMSPKNFPSRIDLLAKFDYVLLNFWPGWQSSLGSLRDNVLMLKSLHPNLLLASYTILDEAPPTVNSNTLASQEKINKINSENWWLRDASTGSMLQWTSAYGTYLINYTRWSHPDAQGLRYPEWVADYFNRNLFQLAPEIDVWYFDNVMWRERVESADWKLTGVNQDNGATSTATEALEVQTEHRLAHVAEWNKARSLAPEVLQIGNVDSDMSRPEYQNQLNAGLTECIIGKSWSLESFAGWDAMMARYRAVKKNLKAPQLLHFGACLDSPTNFQTFRYIYTSALMDDGYVSVSVNGEYSTIAWYDEYNWKLGSAVDLPPLSPNLAGLNAAGENVLIYKREFSQGLAIVNPTSSAVTVSLPAGWRRFQGSQDPRVNSGESVSASLTIPAKDGIVLGK